MRSRFLVLVAATLAVAVLAPGRASAHDLRAVVKLPGDALVVEAGFDDETPAQGAKVTIADAGGNVVAAGETDERGVCRLANLTPGKYTAVVEAVGHRDEVAFEVAGSSGLFEFSNWRPNKNAGLAAGVGGLLAVSGAFWWLRRRRPA